MKSDPDNFYITRYHLNIKFRLVLMAASISASSRGNHDRFPIWRMPYYRLWAGQAGRHTVARVYATREEKKNLTGYVSIGQPTAAGGLLVAVP